MRAKTATLSTTKVGGGNYDHRATQRDYEIQSQSEEIPEGSTFHSSMSISYKYPAAVSVSQSVEEDGPASYGELSIGLELDLRHQRNSLEPSTPPYPRSWGDPDASA